MALIRFSMYAAATAFAIRAACWGSESVKLILMTDERPTRDTDRFRRRTRIASCSAVKPEVLVPIKAAFSASRKLLTTDIAIASDFRISTWLSTVLESTELSPLTDSD